MPLPELPELDDLAGWDELFGVDQTPTARIEYRLSRDAVVNGRKVIYTAGYGDNARIVTLEDEDGEIATVVEPEEVHRTRVIDTTLRLFEDGVEKTNPKLNDIDNPKEN